jgi:glycosyltransferase involved in cell wall biosynthesis
MTADRFSPTSPDGSLVVASLPAPIVRNPYQSLLYRHLEAEGITVAEAPRFCFGWLWRNRGSIAVLHFHWPEPYYRHYFRSPLLSALLSWVRFGLFAGRLVAARVLGYGIVWTVHQVHPHETESRALDRAAAVVLARLSACLIVHDAATAAAVARPLGSAANIRLIPHGSYVGVYPEGRGRDEVRRSLGIAPEAFVVLSFGQIRRYKDLGFLTESFERAAVEGAVLLVTGLPVDEEESRRLVEAAGASPQVVVRLGYVPDDGVAELFHASDLAVSARNDGGTSGALILALSLGVPVVAASAYEDLTDGGRAGWHFEPGSVESLAASLRAAAADPGARAEKGRAALERATRLAWPEIAAETAAVLRSAVS